MLCATLFMWETFFVSSLLKSYLSLLNADMLICHKGSQTVVKNTKTFDVEINKKREKDKRRNHLFRLEKEVVDKKVISCGKLIDRKTSPEFWVTVSVTRLGHFKKLLIAYFLSKVGQSSMVTLWAKVKTKSFYFYFLGNFWKNLGYFFSSSASGHTGNSTTVCQHILLCFFRVSKFNCFFNSLSHLGPFYRIHQCSWTLTSVNSKQWLIVYLSIIPNSCNISDFLVTTTQES